VTGGHQPLAEGGSEAKLKLNGHKHLEQRAPLLNRSGN
jgi:hypothetical protein